MKLFDIPVIGKRFIKKNIIMIEGGEQQSTTLRKYIAKKYKVYVGMYSYGGMFAPDFNIGGVRVSIGCYCSFASGINYYGANHPFSNATMSPYFYNRSFGFDVQDIERHSLSIGNDVWIGYGVIITCGCHSIGNGSVIGAGSVVTKDIQPYSIVGGTPAHEIRRRFDDKTITMLEKSRWWELPPNELYLFYDSINKPIKWAEQIIDYRVSKNVFNTNL